MFVILHKCRVLKWFVFWATFVGFIASCFSLKCYSCMSSRDGNCEDERQMDIKECESSPSADNFLGVKPVCLKLVKDIRGFDHITRSCAFEGSILKPCTSMTAEHCSTCDTNYCNHSTKLNTNISLLSMPMTIVMFQKVVNSFR